MLIFSAIKVLQRSFLYCRSIQTHIHPHKELPYAAELLNVIIMKSIIKLASTVLYQ